MGTSHGKTDLLDATDNEEIDFKQRFPDIINRKRLTANQQNAKSDLIEKVTVVPGNMDESIERWILEILQGHYLFCSLSDSQLMQVVRRMIKCTISAEDYIFKMGDKPGAFFIIEKGNVDVQGRGGYKKCNLSRDDSFGQLGLLYECQRSASIKAKVDCEFWCLTKNNFKLIEKQIVNQNYKNSIKYVNQLHLFQYVTEYQKNSIACSMFTIKYPKQSIIYKKNDEANSFFIIKNGEVILRDHEKQTNVKQNSYFGDQCFESTRKPLRVTSAQTVNAVECFSITRQIMKSILGQNVKQLMNYNILKSALSKSQFFSKLDPISLEKLIYLSKIKNVKNQEVLFQAERQPNKIIVILYGEGFNQKIGTLLGEEFMLLDRRPSVVIRKQGDGEIAELQYQRIIKILKQPSIQSLRRRKYKVAQQESEDEQQKQRHRIKIKNEQINRAKFQNLTVIKILSEGQQQQQYQKVILAENNETGTLFSVRMIKKWEFNQKQNQNRIAFLLQQKQILEQIEHPFLVKLVKKHKDEHFLYFVSEYNWHYSLFVILREIGLLNKTITKFYIAMLISALEYLHSKQIVLRDLKPENIMVYQDGYLKIRDFTYAKKLNKSTGYRTFTQIGSPHYMAPQIISGKGYSFAVDLWSVGIMFYEFVIGRVPFGNDQNDPYKIQQEVLNKNILYPNQYQDGNGKQIIEQLLNRSPELRLSKGYNNLKAHSFFNNINWKKLLKKEETAPFKSKKFYYGQILPLNTKLYDFIDDQKGQVPKFIKTTIIDWDQEF